jgi:hypothetical protein
MTGNTKAILAGVGLLVAGSATGAPQPRHPRTYALTLARSGVPVVLVVPKEFFSPGGMTFAEIDQVTRSGFGESLGSSLALFNAVGGRFGASERDDVVHIRELDEPAEVTSSLERTGEFEAVVGLPVLAAMLRRVVPAMRGYAVEGLIGSGGLLTPGPDCPIDRRVDLPGGVMTASTLLDEIVRQAPGLVVAVTYRRPTAHRSFQVNVGFLCPSGSSMLSVIGPD